jgi:hypothetical protein
MRTPFRLIMMPLMAGSVLAACEASPPAPAPPVNAPAVAASDTPSGDLSTDAIARISQAVVQIALIADGMEVGEGSGTLVSPTGRIFTNRHVIAEGDEYHIYVLEDPNELPVYRYQARLIGFSSDFDFAELQIDRDRDGNAIDIAELALPYVDVRASEHVRGDDVYVFGYPGVGEGYLNVTQGTITAVRSGNVNDVRIPTWYQTDAQIAPGNSGGLAVDAAGAMVGIPSWVVTEYETGGRLGGILAIGAVDATGEAGLDTDRNALTSARLNTVSDDGRLDFSADPTFGEERLEAGFVPDPYEVQLVSGGEVSVDYLEDGCVGYAAIEPDFRLHWTGTSGELRVLFVASEGGDTTLIVNRPDGSWQCNDDTPDGVNPMVIVDSPLEGQYDVWVGSFEPGAYVEGTLAITELNRTPAELLPVELEIDTPTYGELTLSAGFAQDPNVWQITAGGGVDVSYLGAPCVGFAATAPDLRLDWSGDSDELRMFFAADDMEDTTLIVNLPDGTWQCNDDTAGGVDPMLVFSTPQAGYYDIWVGSYRQGDYISGTFFVTEWPIGPIP